EYQQSSEAALKSTTDQNIQPARVGKRGSRLFKYVMPEDITVELHGHGHAHDDMDEIDQWAAGNRVGQAGSLRPGLVLTVLKRVLMV
ncbi:hypothetical protein J6590_003824, partial [Homalodisca vitripennis]